MYCPNCGKELQEGQVCDCMSNQATTVLNSEPTYEAPVQEAPVYEEPPQYYAQQTQQAPYYDPNQSAANFAAPAPSTEYPEGYKPKKKYVAIILAFFLGVFGIHNFYLGNSSKATAQLLITILGSFVFGLGALVTTVWVLIEEVQLLVDKIDADANGYKIMTLAEEIAKAQKD